MDGASYEFKYRDSDDVDDEGRTINHQQFNDDDALLMQLNMLVVVVLLVFQLVVARCLLARRQWAIIYKNAHEKSIEK